MSERAAPGPEIPWEAIGAVGFDLMDTLIADPFREALVEVTGDPLRALEGLVDRQAWPAFELGQIDEAEYGARFFREGSGRRLDAARLREALFRRYRFLPGVEPLLADLSRRLPLHVLSNYSPWYEAIRVRFRLDRFVTGHHVSYMVGARKPDPEFFHRAVARIGVREGTLLFVDDREKNVAAARALGIPSILFRDAVSLRETVAPLLARPGH